MKHQAPRTTSRCVRWCRPLALDAERLLCTFEHGVLRWNIGDEKVESVRLPVLSDAAGFGRLPQMVLAFGGEDAALEVEQGRVLTSARLDELNFTNDSSLSMTGVLPYAYGNDTATVLLHGGTYTRSRGLTNLPTWMRWSWGLSLLRCRSLSPR